MKDPPARRPADASRGGSGSRPRYHHGDLRAALLDAAEEELAASGYGGFSLRGAARRAGVSHAAPAHHFGDAAGLLAAVAARGFDRLTAAMRDEQARAPADPVARVVAAGIGYVDFARRYPALLNLMFAEGDPDTLDDEQGSRAEAAFTVLTDAVSAVVGYPAMSRRAGRRRVAAAWSLVHGFATLTNAGRLHVAADLGDADRRRLIRAMLEPVVAAGR